MIRNSRWSVALCAVLLTGACAENPTAVESPDLSVRTARPVKPAGPSISVIALGTLPYVDDRRTGSDATALALSNGTSRASVRVAGFTRYSTNPTHPFTWTQSAGISALQVVELRPGWVNGVSDDGMMVGEINTSGGVRPFVVTASGPMSYLPVPSGGEGRATGISADGSCISGNVWDGPSGNAVIWRNGELQILGPGEAKGVSNDCLSVVGTRGGRAVVWGNTGGTWTVEVLPERGPGARFVGPVKSTEGVDISPSGEYASGRRLDSASVSAVVWRRTTSGWVATDMPGSTGYALGVDNAGRAVGQNSAGEPMVWTRSSTGAYTAYALPSLSRNTTGWAAAINELGQVAGRSRNREGWQPVLWTID